MRTTFPCKTIVVARFRGRRRTVTTEPTSGGLVVRTNRPPRERSHVIPVVRDSLISKLTGISAVRRRSVLLSECFFFETTRDHHIRRSRMAGAPGSESVTRESRSGRASPCPFTRDAIVSRTAPPSVPPGKPRERTFPLCHWPSRPTPFCPTGQKTQYDKSDLLRARSSGRSVSRRRR